MYGTCSPLFISGPVLDPNIAFLLGPETGSELCPLLRKKTTSFTQRDRERGIEGKDLDRGRERDVLEEGAVERGNNTGEGIAGK